jgi:hypothetical protein
MQIGALTVLWSMVLPPAAASAAPAQTTAQSQSPSWHGPVLSRSAATPYRVRWLPRWCRTAPAFLWIAPATGWWRYDGYRFHPQELDTPHPLARNLGWIRALLAGRATCRVWIGRETEAWPSTSLPIDPLRTAAARRYADQESAAPRVTIRALAEDSEGAIWVGRVGEGLERYEGQLRTAPEPSATNAAPASLPDDRVQALLVDRTGSLRVGSWQAWRDASRVARASSRCSRKWTWTGASCKACSRGRIGPAVGRHAGCTVVLIDAQRSYRAVIGRRASAVNSLVETLDGQIWIGRDDGHRCSRRSRRRSDCRRCEPTRPDAGTLAGGQVTGLLRDQRRMGFWVGGLWAWDCSVTTRRTPPSAVRGADAAGLGRLQMNQHSQPSVLPMTARSGLRTTVGGIARPGSGACSGVAASCRGSVGRARAPQVEAMAQDTGRHGLVGTALQRCSAGARNIACMQSLSPTRRGQCCDCWSADDGALWIGTEDRALPASSKIAQSRFASNSRVERGAPRRNPCAAAGT